MRRFLFTAAALIVVALLATPDSSAQFRIGPDGTVNVGHEQPLPWARLRAFTFYDSNRDGFATGMFAMIQQNSTGGVNGTVQNTPAGRTGYGLYGRGTAGNEYAAYFEGSTNFTQAMTIAADERMMSGSSLKNAGENVISRLMELDPRSVTFPNGGEFSSMALPDGDHFVLTAQDVERVFPNLVSNDVHPGEMDEQGYFVGDPVEYKSVNYTELIPVLVRAIQEQQAEIEELKAALGRQ